MFGLFKGHPMPSPLRNIAIITNTLYTIVVFFSIYYIFISRFVDILREMEIPWNWCCQWKQSTHVWLNILGLNTTESNPINWVTCFLMCHWIVKCKWYFSFSNISWKVINKPTHMCVTIYFIMPNPQQIWFYHI